MTSLVVNTVIRIYSSLILYTIVKACLFNFNIVFAFVFCGKESLRNFGIKSKRIDENLGLVSIVSLFDLYIFCSWCLL
jgi:small neutral amino acid transporter SnatA (MarC family)